MREPRSCLVHTFQLRHIYIRSISLFGFFDGDTVILIVSRRNPRYSKSVHGPSRMSLAGGTPSSLQRL